MGSLGIEGLWSCAGICAVGEVWECAYEDIYGGSLGCLGSLWWIVGVCRGEVLRVMGNVAVGSEGRGGLRCCPKSHTHFFPNLYILSHQ